MLECVVNLSEGRDIGLLGELAAAAGSALLDVHADAIHHRSVFTLASPNETDLDEAVRALADRALALLDLRHHSGIHPRLGVVDVVPFVPLGAAQGRGDIPARSHATGLAGAEAPGGASASIGGSLADATELMAALVARDRFIAWFAGRGVPCFEYGPERSLPEVRRRAFRDLSPSAGPDRPHSTAGSCCVGARRILVAYNILLMEGPELARSIASALRGPAVRVLGLDFAGTGQVSFNLVSPLDIGPADAYDLVAARARVAGAELVGLLPRDVLRRIPERRWSELGLSDEATIEGRLEMLGADKH
jgi:glutamate formiminotransferase